MTEKAELIESWWERELREWNRLVQAKAAGRQQPPPPPPPPSPKLAAPSAPPAPARDEMTADIALAEYRRSQWRK